MKILVTGHKGYIGSVMVTELIGANHEVVGLDTCLYEACTFGDDSPEIPEMRMDVRDVGTRELVGYDAIIHLAALSNDPLGDISPECTHDINYLASVRLAKLAREAGVPRFLFASSCSLYGVAGGGLLREDAPFRPITAYGRSKVQVEQEVSKLANNNFSPTFLRNATVYGVSPRLRADLVVNNLVGYAFTTGKVLILSDGTPWRPVIHVQDVCKAFLAVLHAPRELVHNHAFNVGQTQENYRVNEIADIVREIVPGSAVQYASGGGPDLRCYRVDCSKLASALPEFRPQWTVRRGIEQLYAAYKRNGLTLEEFEGTHYLRIKRVLELQRRGLLDSGLRWQVKMAAR